MIYAKIPKIRGVPRCPLIGVNETLWQHEMVSSGCRGPHCGSPHPCIGNAMDLFSLGETFFRVSNMHRMGGGPRRGLPVTSLTDNHLPEFSSGRGRLAPSGAGFRPATSNAGSQRGSPQRHRDGSQCPAQSKRTAPWHAMAERKDHVLFSLHLPFRFNSFRLRSAGI